MAVAGASQLTGNGAARAGALLALADRKFGLACDQFRSLLRSEPKDMTLVFDLAECLGRDGGVVSDSGSPSRWRFRASREETTGLYQSLLEQLPVGHEGRITVFRHLSLLVIAEWEQLRSGASIDDSTQRFAAYPELMSTSGRDTIAYVPLVMSVMSSRTLGPARERAIEHNRGMLRNVGTAWASEQPHVVDSHLALSRALELAGDLSGGSAGEPTALSEIRAARTFASSPLEVLRLRSAELRIQVKNGEFAAARAMADSAILSERVEIERRWVGNAG